MTQEQAWMPGAGDEEEKKKISALIRKAEHQDDSARQNLIHALNAKIDALSDALELLDNKRLDEEEAATRQELIEERNLLMEERLRLENQRKGEPSGLN